MEIWFNKHRHLPLHWISSQHCECHTHHLWALPLLPYSISSQVCIPKSPKSPAITAECMHATVKTLQCSCKHALCTHFDHESYHFLHLPPFHPCPSWFRSYTFHYDSYRCDIKHIHCNLIKHTQREVCHHPTPTPQSQSMTHQTHAQAIHKTWHHMPYDPSIIHQVHSLNPVSGEDVSSENP